MGFQPHLISVYDWSYHRSVVNLIPETLSKNAQKIPDAYRRFDEKSARKKFRPTPVMNQLRAAFWVEYNSVQTHNHDKMTMARVYAGICSHDYWENVVIHSKEMLCWLLIPPQNYQALLDEAWDAGLSKLREIIDVPIYDEKGKLQIQASNLVIKVWQILDQRKHGSVVQKHMNVNLTGDDAKEVAQMMEQNSMEALNFRLKAIKKKMDLGEKDKQELEASPMASIINDK